LIADCRQVRVVPLAEKMKWKRVGANAALMNQKINKSTQRG
jgi:hypothetical protein